METPPTGVIGLGMREGVEGLPVGVAGRLIVVVSFVGWLELDVTTVFVDSILLFSFCLESVFLLFSTAIQACWARFRSS